MRADFAWGHDSGTHELPRVLVGRPLTDLPTVELSPVFDMPEQPVPTRRRTIPARIRAAAYLAAVTLGAGLAHLAAVTL